MATIPAQRNFVPSTPASLTQAGAAPSGVCPSCSGSRVTRISMTLTDGSPGDFVSCHDCEHKHWRGSDGALALDGVLDRARKR